MTMELSKYFEKILKETDNVTTSTFSLENL